MKKSSSSKSSKSSNSEGSSSSLTLSTSNKKDKISTKGECIRNTTNFSKVKSFHLMDKGDFNPEILDLYIDESSPKLKALFEKINTLDKNDMKKSGKLYKHMIFTDVKKSSYGAKIISSALISKGFSSVIHPQGTGFALYDNDKLLETKGNNFGTLMSKTFYNRSMNSKFIKKILDIYNSRPDNINGDLMRFIILDQGFKEGIDLFDVKYVHLFEPLSVNADEKQAIGRGTRFCGQKGLEFHPRFGWPLYVYRYDLSIPKQVQNDFFNLNQLFELYIKFSNLDLRKIIFAAELEKTTIGASIDFNLNESIRTFTIENPPPILSDSSTSGGKSSKDKKSPTQIVQSLNLNAPPPTKKMGLTEMHKYIDTHFKSFQYPPLKLENNCGSGGSLTGNLVSFTNTQDFVRHYFRPSSAYKGILLHHSVGTGKTCTAIATATSSFDKEGYTILWVTRHTLKNDIWKNMYNQVCSIDIQEKIAKGLVLPQKIGGPMRYISKNWMKPISYKQFSNMLLKKNNIYNEIIQRNSEKDPLRKTLLIIDEVHKLYSPTVAKNEKPNTDILEDMIQNSYNNSGDDSVRVLLMTATPFTEDGMEMIKLLNLLKTKDEFFPTDFNDFTDKYLDENGFFTKKGTTHFQNEVSGYISYLNRSQDGRNFSHPIIENVIVPMSLQKEKVKNVNKNKLLIKEIKNAIKMEIEECKDKVLTEIEIELDENENDRNNAIIQCNNLNPKEKKTCIKNAENSFKETKKLLNMRKKFEVAGCKDLKSKKQREIEDIKDKMDDNKEIIRDFKDDIRESRNNIRKYRLELVKHTNLITINVKKMKKIANKEERNKKLREFRSTSPSFKLVKELKKNITDERVNISKTNISIKTLKLKDGTANLGDLSQQKALHKNCKV